MYGEKQQVLKYSFYSALLLTVTLCSIKHCCPQSVIIFILRIFLLNMLLWAWNLSTPPNGNCHKRYDEMS